MATSMNIACKQALLPGCAERLNVATSGDLEGVTIREFFGKLRVGAQMGAVSSLIWTDYPGGSFARPYAASIAPIAAYAAGIGHDDEHREGNATPH